jgi:tRNA(adenine34) deaminase
MKRAVDTARRRHDPGAGDPPVGAVLYDADGDEVAAAHHDRAITCDPTAHAEMAVLRTAGMKLGTWRLHGCTLVTTIIVLARLPTLVI